MSNTNKKYNLIKASGRGFADHGWLRSAHSFSFANYYNPEMVHFGALRVLNDDYIAAGEGFGKHPHDNMEIISIPLSGELRHGDSMGNATVIKAGEVQVMSAGTGIIHSEMNNSSDIPAEFLQIWVFPNQKNVEPRYDQKMISPESLSNKLGQIVSPIGEYEGDGVQIYQKSWFYLGRFDQAKSISFNPKNTQNGLYLFLLEGSANVDGYDLNKRDALTVLDAGQVDINMEKDSMILLIEVPMSW